MSDWKVKEMPHARWAQVQLAKLAQPAHIILATMLSPSLQIHLYCTMEIPLTQWDFLAGVGPLWFSIGSFPYKINTLFEFDRRATYFGSLRAKLILAPLGTPKWVWPTMNPHRMFFIQTSTPPPRMYHKLTKSFLNMEELVCKIILNQKSHWVRE